jgi:ribosomal protein S18 acetylase RimI-like enzyme
MIRQASIADLPLVKSISSEAYAAYEPLLGGLPLPALEDYAPRIGARQVWIMDADGLLVLETHDAHTLVYSVAVHPASHGQGIGRQLLTHAETVTRGAGLAEVRLYTNALMDRNIAIYTGYGYVETGRRPHPDRPSFTIVDMVKRLA